MSSNGEEKPKGLSFGFAKTISSKPKFSIPDKVDEKDFVLDVSNGRIESSKPRQIKEVLVIPCAGNTVKLSGKLKQEVSQDEFKPSGNEEADKAARLILDEARKWQEEKDRENLGRNYDPTFVVPLSADDKAFLDADLEKRAEVSSFDDYEKIPVEGFGLGMLRGMGFKEGQGIGGFKQQVVPCIEPAVRPKGLGLGAARPGQTQKAGSTNKDSKTDEELILKRGSFVFIETGSHKNLYGQIEGLDEETARVVVKLSVGGQSVSISENVIRVVTKTEYKEFSKIINKDSYTKYKDQQKLREVQWDKDRSARDSNIQYDGKRRKKSRTRSRSNEREQNGSKKYKVDSEKYSRKEESNYGHENSSRRQSRTWLRPQLRVRIIDKKYKGGKYYNTKVIVEDVTSNEYCICRTESGRILDDISCAKCETIIPKNHDVVMVVRGSNAGRLANILQRDKSSSRALLEILPDKEDVVNLGYDDICEYIGEDASYF